MTFRVEMTRAATREVERRYADLAERSKSAADRWQGALRGAIAALGENPERCPQAPESEWYGDGLRELYFGKRRHVYRMLFEIRGTTVTILRVRHGRQNLIPLDQLRPPPEPNEP